jgi:hypothetical protein
MRIAEKTIEVRQNLSLIARERGKIVARRDGHNIWLNLGREYLAQLIHYTTFTPPTPERDDRIRYIGLGIGGNRQQMLGVVNSAPFSVAYPGSNVQTDNDPMVTQLERPVRISGSADPYPGQASDVWLAQIQAPSTHPVATQTTFSRVFTSLQVSYGPFLSVPLSEIGLFTSNANPNIYNNTMVAYDTFDTLSKTAAFELEVNWTIRF